MSLEAKIERLEKIARASSGEDDFRADPELLAFAGRLLTEATERQREEQNNPLLKMQRLRAEIAELRGKLDHYQEPEPMPYGMESMQSEHWLRLSLGIAESELAKLVTLS